MATADTMSASSGPRYAPDDPTLPKPWKGLIDGITGAHYYWNPETNVTQYERPHDALHPLPSRAPLPANAAPSLNPTSVAHTSSGPQLIQPVLQTHHYPALQTAQQQGTQPLQPLEQASQQQVVQQSPMLQMQQVPYQQNLAAQRQPIPYQQGQMHVQQVPPGTFPQEDLVYQHGKPGSHSTSQMENNGTHPSHVPQLSFQPHTAKEVSGYSINAPEDGSPVHVQHGQNDGSHKQQYTPPPHVAPKHTGHSMLQHPQGASLGSRAGYDQSQRAGCDLQYNSHSAWYEGQTTAPQLPFPASVPVLHNQQQETRKPVPMQNGPYGHSFGMNVAAGHSPTAMYNQPSVRPSQTYVNNASGWHAPKVSSSSDFQHLSAADAYRQQHEVTAMGDNVPAPFMTFEDTGFPPEILREINTAGFTSPTPIQAQTWPIAIQSRDIVAIAKTGSGKTLGYLIPAFIHLRRVRNNSQVGPVVLVLAPTRELATQILNEAIKFGRSSRVSCTCLYGGAPKGPQLRELERGVDIVVATPGRLNDILDMRKINFSQISFLILDEADRMLDMGFEPQIRKIVNEIPPRRQTLMYTATWPKEVRKIAGDLLVNPVQVNIGSVDELAANDSITQYVEVVSQMGKQQRLEQILRSQERESKVIIFCATKRQCDQLARILGRNFRAVAIHGDKSQGERDWVLNQFRSGKVCILVATDVAARGLDIKDIRVVINYDFPTGIGDYVHRIGRTGRAGATGVAFTFLSDQDWKYAADLVKVLEGANQQVPPEVREMAARGGQFHKDHGGMNRRDSNGGASWESRDFNGGRGNGYGGHGGGRANGFGGGHRRGRDVGYVGGRGGGSGFSGHGQDNGYGGRHGGRDNGFSSGRDYRIDFSGGRGSRGRGFGGPGRWGRQERQDRFRSLDGERYESRRGGHRSHSPSPYRGRSRGYNRSSSRSRSRSRSWSRSRSRSWSRSRSRSWSRSPSRGRSRSRSNSYNRHEIRTERTEPVHETNIIPPASGVNSSCTSDVKDALPPSVSQMTPAEDCQTLPNTSQQVNHQLSIPNLDHDEKISGDA